VYDEPFHSNECDSSGLLVYVTPSPPILGPPGLGYNVPSLLPLKGPWGLLYTDFS